MNLSRKHSSGLAHPRRRSTVDRLLLAAAALGAALAAAACNDTSNMVVRENWKAENKVFAGGVEASAQKLQDGHDAYMLYCYACHGVNGDGKGPSSYGLRPPPRDFTKGLFKFARVRTSDDLPNDEDLHRIVRGGLHGTAMLAWDIPQMELDMILQYIKTFAPQKWEKKKKSGEPVKVLEPFELTEDPWAGNVAAGVQKGKELYHLRAECMNCHPGYGTKKEIYDLSIEAAKREPDKFKPVGGFRDDPHGSVAKDSPEYGVKLLPPDFTFHEVRSATAKDVTSDLYRIIAFGVYPIMPAWKGAGLSDSDLWALAHYVKSLMDLRNTPAGAELKQRMATQAAFEVPAPAPPEPTPEEKAAAEKAAAEKAEAEKAEADKDGKKKDEKKKDEKKKAPAAPAPAPPQ